MKHTVKRQKVRYKKSEREKEKSKLEKDREFQIDSHLSRGSIRRLFSRFLIELFKMMESFIIIPVRKMLSVVNFTYNLRTSF